MQSKNKLKPKSGDMKKNTQTKNKKYKYKKRSINISETSSKKLVRLEKRLAKRNDMLNELKQNKRFFIEKSTGLDITKDNKTSTVQEQRNHINELMSIYKIDTNSEAFLLKLLKYNTCKKFLINETCSNDCRMDHDSVLRYYYINHFKDVLLQLQKQFEIDNSDLYKPIIFKDTADRNVFNSLFVYYYKNLLHLVSDYESKIDEYQSSLNIKIPETSGDEDNKKIITKNEINKMMDQALRQNAHLKQYKNLLVKFDEKYSVGLSNYTKFINMDTDDIKIQTIGKYLKRILNMVILIAKKRQEDKNKKISTTFGIDKEFDNKQKQQFTNSTKKHNFFLCNECGFSLSLKDNDQRLLKHFQGKTHLKYVELWEELARINTIFKILKIDPENYLPIEPSDARVSNTNQGYNNKNYRRNRYTDRTKTHQNNITYEDDKYSHKIKTYNSRRFNEKRDDDAVRSTYGRAIDVTRPLQSSLQSNPSLTKSINEQEPAENRGAARRSRRPITPSIEY
ncbi:hypothetical protein ACO0SA_001308 [Hanseniaspora valbyensis]